MKETIAFVLPSIFKDQRGGWGNGYVALPEGHPLFGLKEDWDGPISLPLDANGGITFASLIEDKEGPYSQYNGMWVLGFDTSHSWDTREAWPDADSVMKAALELKAQCDDKGLILKYLQDNQTYYQQQADRYKDKIAALISE